MSIIIQSSLPVKLQSCKESTSRFVIHMLHGRHSVLVRARLRTIFCIEMVLTRLARQNLTILGNFQSLRK